MPCKVLTCEQIDQFLKHGHVVLHDCFSRELAKEWTDRGFARVGYDRNNPATWIKKRFHPAASTIVDAQDFAPRVWQAAGDLVGGTERIRPPLMFRDSFIYNLSEGAERPWEPPSAHVKGWHKDGGFFKHFLDSYEQGLLTLIFWSDVEPRGGGTFIACDSVPVVARFLAQHPEGLPPSAFSVPELIGQCSDFLEVTGRIGDVVLVHPFILHAGSQNHSGVPRLIDNPPVFLKEPMNFNRENPADFSPVERAILNGLGIERLDFKPTAPREARWPKVDLIPPPVRMATS